MLKQNFDEFAQLEQYVSQEDITRIKAELVTCPDINTSLCGTITELSKNHAKSVLITSPDMVIDDFGLIHDSFVFNAANYVAQAAINKEFSILISSKASFYAPLKFGDVLILEAQALFDETSKKREVRVVGHVKEIKVFEASMQIIVTEEHIFKLKRPPTVKAEQAPEEDKNASAPNNDVAIANSLLKSISGVK